MVGETVDSILVKEGMTVEITFLFHSIAMLFLSKHHDSIHIKIYDFLLVLRFLSRKKKKNRLRPKNALNPCILLASF